MKKYSNPEFKFLELTADDVLASSGDAPNILGGILSNDDDTPPVDVWPF